MTQQTDRLNTALAGRYRIERQLGEGGMATVYLCEDIKHKRKVALKLLKPELAAVLGAERFVQEITTTAALQHPHILPLFDSGTADGFLFYVMPLIEGETLREKLNRETQLSVDEAVRIAREVADALEYAHQHGIVHRDVKPENILLHGGHAMVADFGIALAVSAAAGGRMTETGLSLGTPHYMSPEQATAEKEITARSDIYSIGSVLYEMLTGNPPFVGAVAQQVIMKIITAPAEPVTVHRKSVPTNVAAAVMKSLEKLPADRFESAKAFADALGNPAYTNASSASAAGYVMTGRRSVSMRVFVVTTVLAIAAGMATTWLASTRHEDAPAAVHFAFSTAPSTPMRAGGGRTVALSPDGRTVVYSTSDSAGHVRLFVRALDDIAQHPITGTEGATWPFFSPDGRHIGYVVDRQLKKVPAGGGPMTLLAELPGAIRGASWGPNGIVVSIDGRLEFVPSDGGKPAPLIRGDSVRGFWPTVLPGGKAVAYVTSPVGDGALSVVVLATGQVVNLGQPAAYPLGIASGELVFGRPDGTLSAAPFDDRALRLTGPARVVAQELQMNAGYGAAKAALAADGTLVYVQGTGAVDAVVVDMRGAVRPTPVPAGKMDNARYSPDGRRIAADVTAGGRSDVWLYDVASGAAQRILSDASENLRPAWTADGKRILFRSNRGGGNTALWWQPADGSGTAEQLVASPGKDIWEGVLTPDGHTVVYRTGSVGTADIWYRHLTGDTVEKAIATTRFNEFGPAISPDGRWVAYFSDESGASQVYVRPFPGPGAQVLVSVSGGIGPVWSPDSRRIFYFSGTKLVAASVTTTPSFSVTSHDVLFEGPYLPGTGHAGYDVARDGKSFLMFRPVAGASEQIVVIHNWASELRASAKGANPR